MLGEQHELRNRVIADLLFNIRYIEGWNTGIRRMRDGMRRHGLPEPSFSEVGETFKVTFQGPGDRILDLIPAPCQPSQASRNQRLTIAGGGWDACQPYCHSEASFSAQAGALAGVNTLQAYTEWMKGMLTLLPDGKYELRALAVDEGRHNVTAYAVLRGTNTGQGGPVPPTGKRLENDYVYVMQFADDQISHMTKIWNDGISLQQLGWV